MECGVGAIDQFCQGSTEHLPQGTAQHASAETDERRCITRRLQDQVCCLVHDEQQPVGLNRAGHMYRLALAAFMAEMLSGTHG